MLYSALRDPLLVLLKAPGDPPRPPAGAPESISVFRASPRFLLLKLSVLGASTLLVLSLELIGWALAPRGVPALAFALTSLGVVSATLVAAVVRYLLIRFDYDLRYYVLTDRSLRIRRGALAIEESTYTFANVQNLVLQQGPLERLFGLAHLQLDTAGGGAHSSERGEPSFHKGRLEGIELATAAALRTRISEAVSAYGDAGLGDPERKPARSLAAATSSDAELSLLRAIAGELAQLNSAVAKRTTPPA